MRDFLLATLQHACNVATLHLAACPAAATRRRVATPLRGCTRRVARHGVDVVAVAGVNLQIFADTPGREATGANVRFSAGLRRSGLAKVKGGAEIGGAGDDI